MLLKSSSTPLLRSLLPPDHLHHHHDAAGKHSPSPSHSPFAFRCNNKPLSFSDHHRASPTGFRRTHSAGNLNTLSHASDVIDVHEDPFSFDSFHFKPSNKLTHRPNRSILETIPSFSFYGSGARTEEEDDEDDDQQADPEEDEVALENFGIHNRMDAAIVAPEVRAMEQAWTRMSSGDGVGFVGDLQKEMYLARGPGIGGPGGGGGGGGGGRRRSGGGGGGEQHGMEEYYKKMVVENPGNALVLSNYAEFLYQWKGDLRGAEEYYSRAILMDCSQDGEILSKYAKLVWELHRDQQKASSYFQRALQASPQDSHVQAAYANFLWETEEDEDGRSLGKDMATDLHGSCNCLT